ncbi:hypothetical protein C8J57DRAFT_1721287 [Mycena rebaudengoi]|nr:hypothetical protein C8J57DRAFT_1721287 [Mycena rebaudengoi]
MTERAKTLVLAVGLLGSMAMRALPFRRPCAGRRRPAYVSCYLGNGRGRLGEFIREGLFQTRLTMNLTDKYLSQSRFPLSPHGRVSVIAGYLCLCSPPAQDPNDRAPVTLPGLAK